MDIFAILPAMLRKEFRMAVSFLQIEELPRRNATQVKNKWRDVVREVHASGSVAVTNHDKVEMIVMKAETYREMTALVEGAKALHQATLTELAAEFDRHLAGLQAADARERVEAVMTSRGRVMPRPKAGSSF
jgi:PHD/YefM family antitoxin component YafN of YafNO toxin-antitoxin module